MIGVIGWFLTLRSSCERLGGLYTLHPSKKDLGCLVSTGSLRFLHSAGLSSRTFWRAFGKGPLTGALSGALLGRVHFLAPFLVHFLGRAHFLAHFWLLFFCFFWRRREKSRTFGRFFFALFSLIFCFFFSLFLEKKAKKERKQSEKKATKSATFFTAPLKRAKKKGPKVRLLARRRKKRDQKCDFWPGAEKKGPKVRLLTRRREKCDQKTGSPHPGTNPTPTQPPRQARFQRVEFRICSQSAEALARLVLGVVSSRGVVVVVWW